MKLLKKNYPIIDNQGSPTNIDTNMLRHIIESNDKFVEPMFTQVHGVNNPILYYCSDSASEYFQKKGRELTGLLYDCKETIGHILFNNGLSLKFYFMNYTDEQVVFVSFIHYAYRATRFVYLKAPYGCDIRKLHISGACHLGEYSSDDIQEQEHRATHALFMIITSMLVIKQNALHEIEYCRANTEHRKKIIGGERFVTDIKQKIHIITKAWYTEAIRDIPFGVCGHFRKQPCGKGLLRSKKIWISAFMKKGYHRRAGVVN